MQVPRVKGIGCGVVGSASTWGHAAVPISSHPGLMRYDEKEGYALRGNSQFPAPPFFWSCPNDSNARYWGAWIPDKFFCWL